MDSMLLFSGAGCSLAEAEAPPPRVYSVCKQVAGLSCSGCSDFTHHNTYYCSKACQYANWGKHRKLCITRIFYHRLRDLDTTITPDLSDGSPFTNAIHEQQWKLIIPGVIALQMAMYLENTDLAARPQFLEEDNDFKTPRVKDEVAAAIVKIKQTYCCSQCYMFGYETRVTKADRDKADTLEAFEVPLEHRPFLTNVAPIEQTIKPTDSASRKEAECSKKGGIELFPQDYQRLSWPTFYERFLDTDRTERFTVNPFEIQYCHLSDQGKEWYDRGMVEGNMVRDLRRGYGHLPVRLQTLLKAHEEG